ncbi:MAG: hypothetical protein ABI647_21370 [Gemmatimonadota bacterium]
MRVSTTVFAMGAAGLTFAFAPTPTRTPPPHDPCKVLTAEQFGRIMGYAATIEKNASTALACFYTGPAHTGGQFRILTEAGGPQGDAMLNRKGSSPPPGSGLLGGTYREGTVVFSVSIKSTDATKLPALVAEVRRNLK